MKKIICLILALLMLLPATVSCSKDDGNAQLLSFSQANSVTEMKKLDGKQVSIIGYMSTLSPVSGKFMYLMNLPYQSCPFCIPNTTQLSNTIAVYAKSADGFKFTDRAIQVVGELEFGEYEDEFGYEYNYRIINATYSVLDTDDMSPKLKLWQQLASTDVISEVYAMYDYLNFLCFWPTYTMEYESGKGFVDPTYAKYFIQVDGAQFNYGYVEGYFDDMIKKIEEVSPTEFSALTKNIKDAEEFAQKVINELTSGNYSEVPEYSNIFNDGRKQYKLNDVDDLEKELKDLYGDFSTWLTDWEL